MLNFRALFLSKLGGDFLLKIPPKLTQKPNLKPRNNRKFVKKHSYFPKFSNLRSVLNIYLPTHLHTAHSNSPLVSSIVDN